ncbi:gamma-butyrobetaine dioxygenase-like isoform X2 [Portunus trituberculatus]|uniref:gamma-butyrobetaine dioxygenase-like isoform X2 n=1 Tax=Portunus trituberculatus TaxID=210409 RepID=UPI001E1D0BDE|nr:gamma-butyrobetaine dioxygenase-like isoform X2 [Portunus trituberculatus]
MLRMGRQVGGSTLANFLKRRALLPLGRGVVTSASKGIHSFTFNSPGLQWVNYEGTKKRSTDAGTTCREVVISGAHASRPIVSVARDHSTGMLKVRWEGGKEEVYPYVWLKDNCRCPSCYHKVSHSRLTFIEETDLKAEPISVQVVEGGQQVEVVWQDDHHSLYGTEWLHYRGFSEETRQARGSRYRLERKFWGTESLDNFPEASFEEIITDDVALLEWLRLLEVYGFVKLKDAPAETGQVRRLAERIAFIRKTHYGDDFTVQAKPDPSNVAYLNGPLQLHADLPYYEYKPGVQFIHCIKQYEGVGGDSQITDAVHVARQLQKACPEHYRLLTDTLVDWFDIGKDETGEFYKLLRLPVICTDRNGEISRINMSQPQRDSHFSVPPGEVADWYAALVAYYRLLSDPKYCLQFKMTPGTIMTFDNLRIVHGRTGYFSGPGERHVQGCYVDWDEVRSRRRVLETKIDPYRSLYNH